MSSSRNEASGGIQWVSADELRAKFNQEHVAERANQGKLMHRVLDYDKHLSRRQRKLANEPYCTRSQMILYTSLNGQPVAIAHQYKRLNGEVGGSGHPDPKWLRLDGKEYKVRQTRDE